MNLSLLLARSVSQLQWRLKLINRTNICRIIMFFSGITQKLRHLSAEYVWLDVRYWKVHTTFGFCFTKILILGHVFCLLYSQSDMSRWYKWNTCCKSNVHLTWYEMLKKYTQHLVFVSQVCWSWDTCFAYFTIN